MPSFVPGRELAADFFRECVKPLIEGSLHQPYAAALLGPGSDVLGFDDETSMDHGWGPRVQILLESTVEPNRANEIRAKLPAEFHGFPLSMSAPYYQPISFYTPDTFLDRVLGPLIPSETNPIHWLLVTQQELRSVTANNIFFDGIGLQEKLSYYAWYPQDIVYYQLASLWSRIGEEEHLVGRAGYVAGEVGARVIASRIVRDIVRMAFLFEQVYAPYPKWFGTAFGKLHISKELMLPIRKVLFADNWESRDEHLAHAYSIIANRYNQIGFTPGHQPRVVPFHDRPFSVVCHESGVVSALLRKIEHPGLQQLKARRAVGSIEIFSDSTDLIESHEIRPRLQCLYE